MLGGHGCLAQKPQQLIKSLEIECRSLCRVVETLRAHRVFRGGAGFGRVVDLVMDQQQRSVTLALAMSATR